jgi:hypothetical protein
VLSSKKYLGSCIARNCVRKETSTTNVKLAFLFIAAYGFRSSRKVSGDIKSSSYLWKEMVAGILKPYNSLHKQKIQVKRTSDKRLSSYKRIRCDEKDVPFSLSFPSFVGNERLVFYVKIRA